MASIRKRGKKWEFTVSYKDQNGQLKRKTKSGFDKKANALEVALELEKKLDEGLGFSDNVTLVDYYQKWLDTYKIGKHTRVTEVRYGTIKKQLAAYFGSNKKLKDITRTDRQQFINFFGKTRAKETVSKLNSYLAKTG